LDLIFLFFEFLVTAIGGRSKPESCFLPGRLRWTLLSKDRYSNSLSGCGSYTQPSNWEEDTLPLSSLPPHFDLISFSFSSPNRNPDPTHSGVTRGLSQGGKLSSVVLNFFIPCTSLTVIHRWNPPLSILVCKERELTLLQYRRLYSKFKRS